MYRVALPDDLRGAPEGAAWTNRLIHETSPYLLQHAHNPVDWHPWGDQAFEKARGEDKPILLSMGYAACHWCHVMEHESFADPRVSAFLNTRFVPIKVDREERPDVDALYIEALLAFQGHAGWPANLFLLPDLRPFTGVTYLPPKPRYGMPSFEDMLRHVAELWTRDRDRLEASAGAVTEAVARVLPPADDDIDHAGYRAAVAAVVAGQDPMHAGHGTGQKFPQTSLVELMALGAADGDPAATRALSDMLRAMASGGLRDHLGGGFHRYCVDRAWAVPHFEKMLYDNAQLLRLYARAASLFADDEPELSRLCVRAARDTVRYLWTDLRDDGGAFQASEDADDPGGEGFFYTFTPDEARAVLGNAGPLPYGIDDTGNFEHGRTVLSTWSGAPAESVRQALLAARNRRARPALDHKHVVAWNGLAFGALAEAGRLLGFDDWIDDAAGCAAAVLDVQDDQGLLPRLLAGGAPGTLDDQVMVVDGLLDLYQARPTEPGWLDAAAALVDATLSAFAAPGGALYQSRPRPDLIKRRVDFQDGAEPSANGRMSTVLQRLVALGATDQSRLDALIRAGSGLMARAPQAAPELWSTVRALSGEGPWELVIAGPVADPVVKQMLRVWNRRWRPQGIVVLLPPGSDLAERYALLRGKASDVPVAYACRHGICALPVRDAAALEEILDRREG